MNHQRNRSGFSLLEVLGALTIGVIGAAALISATSFFLKNLRQRKMEVTIAKDTITDLKEAHKKPKDEVNEAIEAIAQSLLAKRFILKEEATLEGFEWKSWCVDTTQWKDSTHQIPGYTLENPKGKVILMIPKDVLNEKFTAHETPAP